MNKCYYRIIWENYPSDKTPLNKQNLNKIDVAVDEMDNRILSIDATKFDKSEAQLLVKYIEYDEDTGIFKITHYNGASYTIDTLLEKLAINFDYDYQTQRLIIELSDGTVKYVDLSALLTQYEFLDSETVAFTVDSSGKVTAKVKEGSIEEKHLRPDYLADIKVEAAKAQASQQAAATSESNAKKSADAAKASETAAKESEISAAESKKNAADSASVAASKATEAAESADASATSADNAKNSETNAKTSENNAENSKTAAAASAANANASAITAGEKATAASNYADEAESYAHGGTGTREGEDTDNAMEYARQAKESAEKAHEIAGGDFIPNRQKGAADGVATLGSDGKVPKSQLPSDIGSVTGVKGIKEETFRTGNVDITPENVGALPLSGGIMDDNATIRFDQTWFDDAAIEISSDDGASTTICPEFIRITGSEGRSGYIQADSADVKKVDTYADEDLIHRNNSGEYPVLDTNNLQKYIKSVQPILYLPADIRIGDNIHITSNSEGGNYRLIAPDGTWWEIDAFDGNLRIFTYANNVKTAIVIDKMGRVTFPFGLYGTLRGDVIVRSQDNIMGTRVGTSGVAIDLPSNGSGYAGGLAWYQGDNIVGVCGYYNRDNYYYVGTDYAAPNGELRTGNIHIQSPYALYARHIEGSNNSNLFLNYNNSNMAVIIGDTSSTGAGYGTINIGKKVSLYTNSEGGNITLTSPTGIAWEMDAYNDNLRILTYANGVKTGITIDTYGQVNFPESNISTSNNVLQIGGTDDYGTGILYAGSRTALWTDGEGGNLSITSPSGIEYQMDAVGQYKLRLYERNGSVYTSIFETGDLGRFYTQGGLVTAHIWGITQAIESVIAITPRLTVGMIKHNDTTVFIGYHGNGNLIIGPRADNVYDLGWSEARFKNIYATTSVISTSDETTKRNITPLDENLTKDFIMGLNPISYIKKDGESGRTHYGLGAQSVERLMEELGMTSMDFAGLIKSPMYEEYEVEEEVEVEKLIPNENGKPIPQKNKEIQKVTKQREIPGEYRYGLRYEEFIAPLIKMVQMQERKIETLTEEIQELKQMFSRFSNII